MAEVNKDVTVTVKGKDETGKAFKSASKNASLFGKDVDNLDKNFKKLTKTFASLYIFDKALSFIGGSIEEYDTKIQYATKLEYLLKKTTDATDEQVKALLDQANALQKVGVVSDDVAVALQGQLATFELSSGTIKKMTPAILDMVVAEKGINATTQDMIEFGNAFGMALEGNYASLTRRGFKIDENTKSIIKLGTEEQKADAITKYLTDTYGGLNEAMRNTSQGGVQALRNSFGDFREDIGEMASFFRDDFILAVGGFFETTLNMGNDWSKDISRVLDVGFGLLGKIATFSAGGLLGIVGAGQTLLTGQTGIWDTATKMLENPFEDLDSLVTDFEVKWANKTQRIVTPTSEGGLNALPELADTEDIAKKMKKSFEEISKSIVSSFSEQTSAIRTLRDELQRLEADTDAQLSKADARYQEDLKNKAKQSQERIDQIDKEIKETRDARSQGWRTHIAELEAEKSKEQSILSRIGGEVTNLNAELAKDDLTILKEKLDAEKALIREEAEKTKAEKEAEIDQRTGVQLRGVLASMSPALMDTLIAENQSFLGQIGAGANQYIFTFNGDVNDKDKLIKVITEALNRQATLKGVAGQ